MRGCSVRCCICCWSASQRFRAALFEGSRASASCRTVLRRFELFLLEQVLRLLQQLGRPPLLQLEADRLDIELQVFHGAIAPVAVFLNHARDEMPEPRGKPWNEIVDGTGLLEAQLVHQALRVRRVERMPTGQQFVEDHAVGKDVAPGDRNRRRRVVPAPCTAECRSGSPAASGVSRRECG